MYPLIVGSPVAFIIQYIVSYNEARNKNMIFISVDWDS